MCGIAGIWDKRGGSVHEDDLRIMASALTHRGPDASGVWTVQGLGLAHCRLKILDLSDAANQPFTDGRDVLVFNGEIFNYRRLRRELEASHTFTTSSDTEVLFRALQTWGDKALERLDGQFAFAFFNARERTLLLARDHVGICPLYVCDTGKHVIFASEIAPILAISPAKVSPSGIVDFLGYRYNIQNGRTLFEGIRRLDPATCWRIELDAANITSRCYWRFSRSPQKMAEADAQANFNDLLDSVISDQSMADVPVGLYLSGGIDSRALLHGFSKNQPDLRSYTVSFAPDDPDTQDVLGLATKLGFTERLLPFLPAELADIENTVRALQDPFGDFIICANAMLAREAAKSVRVVLSGEGGDEALLGYGHQRSFLKLARLGAHPVLRAAGRMALCCSPPGLLSLVNSYPGGFGVQEKARINEVFRAMPDTAAAYRRMVCLFTPEEVRNLLAPGLRRLAPSEPDPEPIDAIFAESGLLEAVLRAEIEQMTLIVNLLKQDRFGMRHSLEARVPLVSRRVLEFVATLPDELIHSAAVKPLLTRYSGAIRLAKRPFSLFASPQFRAMTGVLMDRYLGKAAVESDGLLHWPAVAEVRSRVAEGGILGMKKAMSLVVLSVWWRVFRPGLG